MLTRTMRWIVTIAVTAWLVLGAFRLAPAIDAKPKSGSSNSAPADTGTARKKSATRKASNQSLLEKLKKDVRESKRTSGGQYDNYIDRNNDGVDDRVPEKAKVKETDTKRKKPTSASQLDKSTSKKKKKP